MEINVLDGETCGNGDPTMSGLPLDQYDWLCANDTFARGVDELPVVLAPA